MQTESQILHTIVPRVDERTTASSPKAQRIPAIDFTKGALVLIMVLYHWINYFIGLEWGYYRYLRFLTPSFIFVTGFMISNIYLSKYEATDFRLSRRLFTRGLKLLAVFLVLNLARTCIAPGMSTSAALGNLLDARNIFTVLVSGNLEGMGVKLVSFSILVPISYLLMLSGALMFPYRFYKYTFHVVCVFFLLSIATLGLIRMQSANLELITIGVVGVLAGFMRIGAINDSVRHSYMLGFAYLCYTIAITIWNVPFPLQMVGVPLSLMVIYLAGISGSDHGKVKREVILLGKYSLFGYISQIAILQILAAGLRHINLGSAILSASFVAAFALTIMSVEVLDRLRKSVVNVDRLYKAVFA